MADADANAREKFKNQLLLYDYIRFEICDFHGISRGKVIPARNAAKYIDKGPMVWNGR